MCMLAYNIVNDWYSSVNRKKECVSRVDIYTLTCMFFWLDEERWSR